MMKRKSTQKKCICLHEVSRSMNPMAKVDLLADPDCDLCGGSGEIVLTAPKTPRIGQTTVTESWDGSRWIERVLTWDGEKYAEVK